MNGSPAGPHLWQMTRCGEPPHPFVTCALCACGCQLYDLEAENHVAVPAVVFAEVTQPSLGVGYEIGRALEAKKRIFCVFRPSSGRSAVITARHPSLQQHIATLRAPLHPEMPCGDSHLRLVTVPLTFLGCIRRPECHDTRGEERI